MPHYSIEIDDQQKFYLRNGKYGLKRSGWMFKTEGDVKWEDKAGDNDSMLLCDGRISPSALSVCIKLAFVFVVMGGGEAMTE